MLKSVWVFALIAMVAGVLFPFEAAAQDYKIGVSLKSADSDFWLDLARGIEDEAKKYPTLKVTILYGEGDVMTQIGQVESLAAAGVDAVLLAAIDATALGSAGKTVNKAEIPLFAVDTDVYNCEKVTLIASDNVLAGKLGAEYMVKRMNGKGNVILMELPQSDSIRARLEGVDLVLKDEPGIKIIHREAIKQPASEWPTQAENLLTAYRNVDAFYFPFDAVAIAFYRAMRGMGRDKDIFFASVDAIGEALKLIKSSDTFGATVAQQPYLMGQLGIQYAMQYITGKKTDFPDFVTVPVALVSDDNVDKWMK
jgi:ribose transport system substrate-binding protein